MKKFYLHIESKTDCVLKIAEKTFELDKFTNSISLEIAEFQNEFFLYVYPVSKVETYLPYTVKISCVNEKLCCDNNHAQLLSLPQNHYVLFLSNLKIQSSFAKEENSQTIVCGAEKFICSYEIGDFSIVRVKQKDRIKTFKSEDVSYSCEVSKFSCGVVFEFFCTDKNMVVVYLDGEFYPLYGNKIEVSENEIKTLNSLCDLAMRGVVKTYCEKGKILIESKTEFVYMKNTPKRTQNENLFSLAFLESVRADDIEEARRYLSNQLNERLSDDHIRAFFGNMGEIKKIAYYNDDSCVVYDEFKKNPKVFTFEFSDKKISNIFPK